MKLNQFDFIISFFMNPALDELIHVHEFLQGTKNSSQFNYNFYNIWMLKNRLRSQFSNVAKWCRFTNTVQMGKRKSLWLHIKVHHRPLACLGFSVTQLSSSLWDKLYRYLNKWYGTHEAPYKPNLHTELLICFKFRLLSVQFSSSIDILIYITWISSR